MQQSAGGGQRLEKAAESSLPIIEILGTEAKCFGPVMNIWSITGCSFPWVSVDLSAIHSGKVRCPKNFGAETIVVQAEEHFDGQWQLHQEIHQTNVASSWRNRSNGRASKIQRGIKNCFPCVGDPGTGGKKVPGGKVQVPKGCS